MYLIYISPFIRLKIYIQGYPQRIRLQRRLYGICTVSFFILTIPCNCKLVCFFVKYFDNYIWGRKHNLTLESSHFLKFPVVFTVSSFVGSPVCYGKSSKFIKKLCYSGVKKDKTIPTKKCGSKKNKSNLPKKFTY